MGERASLGRQVERRASFFGTLSEVSDVPETRYVRAADGTKLAYQVIGNGPLDLVVLYDFMIPADLLWDDPGFVRVARRLGSFSRTLWCESRGTGASEGDFRQLRIGEVADGDLIAVLDAVGSDQVALIGAGSGGPAAIHFAATHPERVSAIVLVNTHAHYVREPDYPWGLPPRALEGLIGAARETWGTGAALELLAPSRIGDDRFRAWLSRGQRLAVGPNEMAEGLRANIERDVRPLLASVRAPTLVLHREGNRFIRLGAGRYLADHIRGARFVLLPGEDHTFFIGDSDPLVDEIEEFLTGRHQAPEGDLVLATVLFTDIVGSTEHSVTRGPRAWSMLTDEHDALVRSALQRHRGREVKTTGDGFLATFDGGSRAVRCATEIATQASALGIEVRAGLHTGEVEARGDDIAGLAVTIAKRICDLAGPRQVLVSGAMRELLVGSGIPLSDQGLYVLKGVPDEWRLFAVEA